MSIILEKRAEKVGIILAKAGIVKVPPVRVGLALDVSGSAQSLYTGGIIQKTVDRLIPVAMKFDDNGELDMWSFSSGYDRLEHASSNDEGSYVQEHILENSHIRLWGGTEYGPVLEDMIRFWFPKQDVSVVGVLNEAKKEAGGFLNRLFGKKETVATPPVVPAVTTPVGTDAHGQSIGLPAMGILITDGDNSDRAHAAQILQASQNVNVYWQLVGVGASSFKFLEEQADLLPNVGFVNLHSLDIGDDDLYNALIAPEFLEWVKTREQA